MNLGFAVKVLGQAGLKSHDARRWQSGPHLRTSIEYLHEVFGYLDKRGIRMYRMSSDLAPYATHPDLPQFHKQVDECRSELRDLGRRARDQGLRLSFHPSQYIVINSPDPDLTRKSIWDLTVQSEILDVMELGPEAVVVVHTGGVYNDKASALDRWADAWHLLGEPARRRVVLENDDLRFGAADVLALHSRTGVPIVFDTLHHCCYNPGRLPLTATLIECLRTWPSGTKPKIHYSSPRTEMREVKRRNRQTGKSETCMQAPVWTGHADFVNPFEFILTLRSLREFDAAPDFDIMLEAKAKDLALLRLRRDLSFYAPDLAALFSDASIPVDIPEEIAMEALTD